MVARKPAAPRSTPPTATLIPTASTPGSSGPRRWPWPPPSAAEPPRRNQSHQLTRKLLFTSFSYIARWRRMPILAAYPHRDR
jgi:hypothetical protein